MQQQHATIVVLKFIYSEKATIFFVKSSTYFRLQYIQLKVRERFCKILRVSQNIWISPVKNLLWRPCPLKLYQIGYLIPNNRSYQWAKVEHNFTFLTSVHNCWKVEMLVKPAKTFSQCWLPLFGIRYRRVVNSIHKKCSFTFFEISNGKISSLEISLEILDPKIQQTKMLVTCFKGLVFVFIWAGLAVFFSSEKK